MGESIRKSEKRRNPFKGYYNYEESWKLKMVIFINSILIRSQKWGYRISGSFYNPDNHQVPLRASSQCSAFEVASKNYYDPPCFKLIEKIVT